MIVLDCDMKDAMTAIVEAGRLNMSDIVFVMTESMKGKLKQLSSIIAQASGMIYIDVTNSDLQAFKNYVKAKHLILIIKAVGRRKP